jgi:hypothetical protein
MVNDVLKDFIEDILLHADDLDEIDFWTNQFPVDNDLLWKVIDCNLFKVNPPAWETLAYLLGENYEIENVRKLYNEGQYNIKMLGEFLLACETEDHRISLALWRIWAYCILSVESMIVGECIAVQVWWLRGPTVDRASLGKPRLDDGTGENWKLCRTNGIFAQSNNDLQKSDVDDMIQVWHLLKQKWSEIKTGKEDNVEGSFYSQRWVSANLKAAERSIIHIFSRVTGPKDVLNILRVSQPPFFSFERAFRITHRRSRADRGSTDLHIMG